MQVHWGDSTVLVPQYIANHTTAGVYGGPTCDLVHIDGSHSFEGASADFKNMYQMMTCDSHILMDDVFDDEASGPTRVWADMKAKGVSHLHLCSLSSSCDHSNCACVRLCVI